MPLIIAGGICHRAGFGNLVGKMVGNVAEPINFC